MKHVLIADDNADAGDTLGTLLEMEGLEVKVVRDGSAAVQAAAQHMPDVVILDIGMPGLDGWATCMQIRSLPSPLQPRVLALTAWGSEDARARSREAGFDEHWTKPANLPELLRTVCDKEAGAV